MAPKAPQARKRPPWPDARGSMAGLIRNHEWRHTPLGSVDNWPQPLKTAVELMLTTHQPASVCWSRGLVTLYNDACIPLLKNRHPGCLGKSYSEVFPESWGDVRPAVEAALAGEPQQLIGQRVRRAEELEGASWFTWSWSPLRDQTGQVAGLYCTASETILQLGGEQLRTIVENASDGVFMLEASSGQYIYMSPAHAAQSGFAPDELKNMPDSEFWERVHADDRAALQEHLERLTHGTIDDVITEYRWRVKSGDCRWFSVSRKLVRDPGGQPSAIVGVCRDITEQKAADEALRRSEMRFKLATESAGIGTWEWDIASNKVVRNDVVYHLLGIPPVPEGTDADYFWRCVHPDDLPEVLRRLREVHESGTDWQSEFRIIRPDGEIRWLAGNGRVIRDPDGSARAMHGVNYDITEQKCAVAAVAASEKRYRMLHETQRDGFVMVSMDGAILDFNDIYCQMLGYTSDELHARTYLDVTPERWHAFEAAIIRDQIMTRGYSDVYEKEYRRKDGTVFPVELRTILSRDDAGNPDAMWAQVRDITERKLNEAHLQAVTGELIHVGRIAELSQVSAGIAHELNQPLAAMLNYSATAKRMIAMKDEVSAQEAIAKAGDQAMRAAEIIQRMRNFVEKHETKRRKTTINAIIKDAVALGLIGAQASGITTGYNLSPGLPDVWTDPVQIEQVLVNLLRNAVEAMAQSPRRVLTITTGRSETGITLAVADTGSGVPKHMWDKLFQPFVTTKQGGMGIGLAISRSIIEAHGGTITVEPNPGGGTVFRFTLPAAGR